jgi:hypothetical protein
MSLCFLGNSLGINIVFSKVEIRLSSSGDEDGSKVRREPDGKVRHRSIAMNSGVIPFELALEVEVKDLDLKAFLNVLAEQRDSRRR